MTKQIKQTVSMRARGIGLDVVAAINVLMSIGLTCLCLFLAYAVVGAYMSSSHDVVYRHLFRELFEVVFVPFIVASLLLAIGWGLWRRRAWARLLALIVHWPSFVGAIGLLPLCLYVVCLVPARGIAVGHGFAWLGILLLTPALLVSGWML